nr:tetratricopeptide repeat protein [Micromonospora sp. NBC_00855]
MGGRLALVVASQCRELPTINGIDGLAQELLDELGSNGGWVSVLGDGQPLLDPGHNQLRAAISAAFTSAANQQATLLISFIGHGKHDAGEYYLLAEDSPEIPDDDCAINLGNRIKLGLNRHDASRLDGLIVMVDACASGTAINQGADRWLGVIPRNAARMELLTASADEEPAYDACFTRTIIKALQQGDPRGDSLISVDSLRAPIASGCPKQEPGHMSLTMSGAALATRGGDPGLWLVPNEARSDCLKGRPSAALVDQLTKDLFVTDEVRESIAEIVSHRPPRLRMIVGAAGSGKSAIMGMLVRATEPELVPSKYIRAAVFLDAASSPESVAAELTEQLTRTLPGFKDAAAATAHTLTEDQQRSLGALERLVVLPLMSVRSVRAVHVIIDGLDQPDGGNRDALVQSISEMTTNDQLTNLCIIAGVRQGTGVEVHPQLAHGVTVEVPLPSVETVIHATMTLRKGASAETFHERPVPDAPMAGGWLIARLLTEISQLPADWPKTNAATLPLAVVRRIDDASAGSGNGLDLGFPELHVHQMLAILAAAGVGAVLPLDIARAALSALGTELSLPRLRDLIASLGALVSRTAPSTDNERIGLAHLAFVPPIIGRISIGVVAAHNAIADSLRDADSTLATNYQMKAGARHLALGLQTSDAVRLSKNQETEQPADNLARWTALLIELLSVVGDDHSDTLRARSNIATWQGESGDTTGALTAFEQLLSDQQRTLGPDHPDTLQTRSNIASWRGESGDAAGSLTASEQLLPDQERVLGPDHPDTLRTRSNIAFCRGRSGDATGAVAAFEHLLIDRCRVLGPDHPDTLRTRSNIASWTGVSGDIAGALAAFEQVLSDRQRVLGPDHPDTLRIRSNIASCHGRSGGIIRALAGFEQLVADQQRILGPSHPDTLRTRSNIAFCRGESGDTAGAVSSFEQLLHDYTRVLGADHPDTLRIRHNIAIWRSETGDVDGAFAVFEQLMVDQHRVLGPDHPDTLLTRSNIASFHSRSGSTFTAFRQLFPDYARVIGSRHPDVTRIRAWIRNLRAGG